MENGIAVVFLVKGAQEEISEWIRENIVWFPLTEEDTFLRLIKNTEIVKIAIYVVGGRGKLVFVAWDTLFSLFSIIHSFCHFLSFSSFSVYLYLVGALVALFQSIFYLFLLRIFLVEEINDCLCYHPTEQSQHIYKDTSVWFPLVIE